MLIVLHVYYEICVGLIIMSVSLRDNIYMTKTAISNGISEIFMANHNVYLSVCIIHLCEDCSFKDAIVKDNVWHLMNNV